MRYQWRVAGLLIFSMLGCAPTDGDEDETAESGGAFSSESPFREGLYYSHRDPESVVLGIRGKNESREVRVWVGDQSTAWVRPQTNELDLIALSTKRAIEGTPFALTRKSM